MRYVVKKLEKKNSEKKKLLRYGYVPLKKGSALRAPFLLSSSYAAAKGGRVACWKAK
jgi:hypothetical protein